MQLQKPVVHLWVTWAEGPAWLKKRKEGRKYLPCPSQMGVPLSAQLPTFNPLFCVKHQNDPHCSIKPLPHTHKIQHQLFKTNCISMNYFKAKRPPPYPATFVTRQICHRSLWVFISVHLSASTPMPQNAVKTCGTDPAASLYFCKWLTK